MLDLYMLHLIPNAIKYYGADRSLFDPLFPLISETMRTRLWNILQDKTVSFDTAFNTRTAGKLPLITIENSEQFFDDQGLGQHAGVIKDVDGRPEPYAHIFTSQEVSVNIYADTLETVRLLQAITQASVLLFKQILLKSNFQNIIYIGSTTVQPSADLQGEQLATYARSVRFAGLHVLEIPSKIRNLDDLNALDTLFNIQVLHEDQQGSTISGGVSV